MATNLNVLTWNLIALEDDRLLRLAWLIGGSNGRSWAEGDGIEYSFTPAVSESLSLLFGLQNRLRQMSEGHP